MRVNKVITVLLVILVIMVLVLAGTVGMIWPPISLWTEKPIP